MFRAGQGGMNSAGHDLISSCSDVSYSGDEAEDLPTKKAGRGGPEAIRKLLRDLCHL